MNRYVIGLGLIVALIAVFASVNDCRVAKSIPAKIKEYVETHRAELKGDQGERGKDGVAGDPGVDGAPGLPGVNCYDGLTDLNGDGVVDVKDCRGADGKSATDPAVTPPPDPAPSAGGAPAVTPTPAPPPAKVKKPAPKPVVRAVQEPQAMRGQPLVFQTVIIDGVERTGHGQPRGAGAQGNAQVSIGTVNGNVVAAPIQVDLR